MTIRERLAHWWHRFLCRRHGHEYGPWEAYWPSLHEQGRYEEIRVCRRCSRPDFQWAEHVVIVLDSGRVVPYKLTGVTLANGVRVPVLETPLRATLGIPRELPRFGVRTYKRTDVRDAQGRAIFR